jgi:heterodisulfide reductase subunit B
VKVVGYFPGCSLSGTAFEYDRSVRAVAQALDIELREIPEWVCCGSSSAHAVDHEAALCLAADTLAKARKAGLEEVLAPCAMCYQRLATAVHEFTEKPELGRQVAEALGEAPDANLARVRPLNLLDWLEGLPAGQLAGRVKRPLRHLKIACYYGCLLVRPPKVTGATAAGVEAPRRMEKLVQALGAEPVRWSMALECCGASFSLSRKSTVLRQGRSIYAAAAEAGADLIALACPMCQSNLDMRQDEFLRPEERRVPILYLTQAVGLAFDLLPQALGLAGHFVRVEPALAAAEARKEAPARA